MGQTCKVCKLPNQTVKNLERDFINGVPISQIGRTYGVSDNSVKFHTDNHLPQKLVKAAEKTFQLDTTHLVEQIDQLYSWMKIIFQRNYEKGYDKTALKALSEQRNTLQLLAQISMALHKTKVAELEFEKEKQLSESNLNLDRLTKKEKDVYFQILQKLMGDDNVTIHLGYTDYSEVESPVYEEPEEPRASVGGSGIVEEDNFEKPRTPESQEDDTSFKPITEWKPAPDLKLKLSRRRFSRAIDAIDSDNGHDPYRGPVT